MKKLIAISMLILGLLVLGVSRLPNKDSSGKTVVSASEKKSFKANNLKETLSGWSEKLISSKEKPKTELSSNLKIQEVQKLHAEVEDIYKRTGFDHRKMTEKEFEEAVRVLEIYNKKMIELTEDVLSGGA